MRDLRSALSWLLFRDQGCEDVGRLLTRTDEDSGSPLVSLYYPEAFAHGSGRPERTVDDRLVRLLREADVGFVNSPQLDHRLDYDAEAAVPWMTFERRSDYARSVLGSLTRDTPRSINDVTLSQGSRLPDLLRGRRALIARWRRWAYHERRDEGWREMTPYRSLRLLEEVTSSADEPAQGQGPRGTPRPDRRRHLPIRGLAWHLGPPRLPGFAGLPGEEPEHPQLSAVSPRRIRDRGLGRGVGSRSIWNSPPMP